MPGIVLIVDDHPLIAEAFEISIRAAYPELEVAWAATAGEAETFARANARRIRLVLLDLMLPDVTGFSGLLTLQDALPGKPVAIVSGRFDAHSISMAKGFGATAYLNKAAPVQDLVAAVGTLLRGEALSTQADIPPAPAAVDFHRRVRSLSATQFRVLTALADGRLNKQIAAEMNLTEGTVKQHMSAIFRKLGVMNRSQAILAFQPYLTQAAGSGAGMAPSLH